MDDSTAVIGAGAREDEKPELEEAPFHVVGDNIVVELVEYEDTTDTGIVLVKEKSDIPPDVVVVGIGSPAQRHFEQEGLAVELGTKLMTRRNERIRLEMPEDGRELYVLKPAAVVGVY